MGDGGGERDGDVGGDGNIRGGEGALGGVVGGDCDVEGR